MACYSKAEIPLWKLHFPAPQGEGGYWTADQQVFGAVGLAFKLFYFTFKTHLRTELRYFKLTI